MTHSKWLAVALLAFFMAACSPTIPDPEPTTDTVGDSGSDADTSGFDDEYSNQGEEFGPDFNDDGELAMVIFFDFDQSDIRPEDQATLERHATRVANDSSISIRLEGHADERGSREYNIGLGERRSQAVRRILLIQGAAASQISTVSFGEERPVAFGSDEESYAQNRRVEILYTN